MRKIIIVLFALLLVGCSNSKKKTPVANKVVSCEFTSEEDQITFHTKLVGNYKDSELLDGTLTSEMIYEDEKVAKAVYRTYQKEQDTTHHARIYLDENKVTIEIDYPSGISSDDFTDQMRSLEWKSACKTTFPK